jgi:hypothetical protein
MLRFKDARAPCFLFSRKAALLRKARTKAIRVCCPDTGCAPSTTASLLHRTPDHGVVAAAVRNGQLTGSAPGDAFVAALTQPKKVYAGPRRALPAKHMLCALGHLPLCFLDACSHASQCSALERRQSLGLLRGRRSWGDGGVGTAARPQATNAASPRGGGTSESHRPQHIRPSFI